MFIQGIESYIAVIAVLMFIGVPSNIAVVWIHTRKDSRVAKNKFPLIFAVFDLIAMLVALPFEISYGVESPTQAQIGIIEFHTSVLLFLVNGYWVALVLCGLLSIQISFETSNFRQNWDGHCIWREFVSSGGNENILLHMADFGLQHFACSDSTDHNRVVCWYSGEAHSQRQKTEDS